MTIFEKYDLTIGTRIGPISGKKKLLVDTTSIGSVNSVLTFLSSLDKGECEAFLYDINVCLDEQSNGMGGVISDGVEYLYYGIDYQYPNVNIDNVITIPMQDMKEILEELLKLF